MYVASVGALAPYSSPQAHIPSPHAHMPSLQAHIPSLQAHIPPHQAPICSPQADTHRPALTLSMNVLRILQLTPVCETPSPPPPIYHLSWKQGHETRRVEAFIKKEQEQETSRLLHMGRYVRGESYSLSRGAGSHRTSPRVPPPGDRAASAAALLRRARCSYPVNRPTACCEHEHAVAGILRAWSSIKRLPHAPGECQDEINMRARTESPAPLGTS